jgi:hypothetical protein
MVLKRPKQEKVFGPSKAKELLILRDLSPQAAKKFEAALKAIITKVRWLSLSSIAWLQGRIDCQESRVVEQVSVRMDERDRHRAAAACDKRG